MKNGYKIIDAHAHIFPDKIADKASLGIQNFYDLDVTYHGRVSEMLENGTHCGIDGFLINSPATTINQVNSINTFIASVAAAYPMCIPFGTLHPDSPNLEEDFQQIDELKLKGVKLHPDFQNFAIDEPKLYPIYEHLQSKDIPILMHMGDARSDLSHPYRLKVVLKNFPKLRVIAAHLGGWSRWEEAKEVLVPDDRLRFDTSSSLPFMSKEKAVELIHHYGADHCFFGVDYPMWEYEGELERFFDLGLSHEENESILYQNIMNFIQ